MGPKKLEVCIDSVESAIAAAEGGADRLELCAALSEGGLTPTLGLLTVVKKAIAPRSVDVFCMVRPRGGPMTFSQEEKEIIISDTKALVKAGADGIVFGALKSDKTIDVELSRSVQEAADGLPCTFHRAFDLIPDQLAGLETVINLGYNRILTSGGQASAVEGSDNIAQLVAASKGRISVMAGAGIKSSNVALLSSATNAQEFHASARIQRTVGSSDKCGPKMGLNDDCIIWVTCKEEVKKIKEALN